MRVTVKLPYPTPEKKVVELEQTTVTISYLTMDVDVPATMTTPTAETSTTASSVSSDGIPPRPGDPPASLSRQSSTSSALDDVISGLEQTAEDTRRLLGTLERKRRRSVEKMYEMAAQADHQRALTTYGKSRRRSDEFLARRSSSSSPGPLSGDFEVVTYKSPSPWSPRSSVCSFSPRDSPLREFPPLMEEAGVVTVGRLSLPTAEGAPQRCHISQEVLTRGPPRRSGSRTPPPVPPKPRRSSGGGEPPPLPLSPPPTAQQTTPKRRQPPPPPPRRFRLIVDDNGVDELDEVFTATSVERVPADRARTAPPAADKMAALRTIMDMTPSPRSEADPKKAAAENGGDKEMDVGPSEAEEAALKRQVRGPAHHLMTHSPTSKQKSGPATEADSGSAQPASAVASSAPVQARDEPAEASVVAVVVSEPSTVTPGNKTGAAPAVKPAASGSSAEVVPDLVPTPSRRQLTSSGSQTSDSPASPAETSARFQQALNNTTPWSGGSTRGPPVTAPRRKTAPVEALERERKVKVVLSSDSESGSDSSSSSSEGSLRLSTSSLSDRDFRDRTDPAKAKVRQRPSVLRS